MKIEGHQESGLRYRMTKGESVEEIFLECPDSITSGSVGCVPESLLAKLLLSASSRTVTETTTVKLGTEAKVNF